MTTTTTTICSWNVNGVRSVCNSLDLRDFIAAQGLDILCVQETKIDAEALAKFEIERPAGGHSLRYLLDAFDSHWAFCETKKGYCGVATWVRRGMLAAVTVGFGFDANDEHLSAGLVDNFAASGRVLVTDHGEFVLFNVYFPNTNRGDEAVATKVTFQASLERRVRQLTDQGRRVIVFGDVNIVPEKIDTTRPSKVDDADSHCYLPQERDWLARVCSNSLVDAFRKLYPDKAEFTFHSPKMSAASEMRIDLALLNHAAVPLLADLVHLQTHGSDHTPVVLKLGAKIDIPAEQQLLAKQPRSIKSFFSAAPKRAAANGDGLSAAKRPTL